MYTHYSLIGVGARGAVFLLCVCCVVCCVVCSFHEAPSAKGNIIGYPPRPVVSGVFFD